MSNAVQALRERLAEILGRLGELDEEAITLGQERDIITESLVKYQALGTAESNGDSEYTPPAPEVGRFENPRVVDGIEFPASARFSKERIVHKTLGRIDISPNINGWSNWVNDIKKVLDLIRRNNTDLTQRQIGSRSRLNQARVSTVIRFLEYHGLIEAVQPELRMIKHRALKRFQLVEGLNTRPFTETSTEPSETSSAEPAPTPAPKATVRTSGPRAAPGENRKNVYEAIQGNPGITYKGVANLVGLSVPATRSYLTALDEDGLIEPEIRYPQGTAKPRRWHVTDKEYFFSPLKRGNRGRDRKYKQPPGKRMKHGARSAWVLEFLKGRGAVPSTEIVEAAQTTGDNIRQTMRRLEAEGKVVKIPARFRGDANKWRLAEEPVTAPADEYPPEPPAHEHPAPNPAARVREVRIRPGEGIYRGRAR
jgi:hypothetical protein